MKNLHWGAKHLYPTHYTIFVVWLFLLYVCIVSRTIGGDYTFCSIKYIFFCTISDVSLPIWAAVAIAIGGFVAVFLTSWYCYCRYCLVEKESSRNNQDWESTQQSKLFTEISNSQNTIPLNTMCHQSNHDESDTFLLRELGDPSNKTEGQGRVVSEPHNYTEGLSRNMQMEPHQSLPSGNKTFACYIGTCEI